ncbi:ATP-dependent Clp protease ATP-binding subunit [bacterium]|nr:ATP-dependent Clp protease ATP-binding subunit [bacterium]
MNGAYSPNFKRVLQHAREEAARLGHNYIGTEHLLLGIIAERDSKAAELMEEFGVNLISIKDTIEEMLDIGEIHTYFPGHIIMTTRANKAIEQASIEARNLNSKKIGTEHLLLAMLKESKSLAAQVLFMYNITYEDAFQELEGMTASKKGKPDQESSKYGKKGKRVPMLRHFGRNLTELATKGELDPVIGRKQEIERMEQILTRRKKNNPVLMGEPGVGKTAIVEGLAQRIADKKVSYLLQDKQVIALDLTGLVAGTKYRGQFEERIKAIMNEITKDRNIVVFIDEIHTIVGAGGAEGALDASNIFKPALANGEMQCIGATTMAEYRKYIEKDGALERRFQTIIVDPPIFQDTIKILRGLRKRYEEHHSVEITDEAIESAVTLSDRYIPEHFQPDKAIDLIDEAGAMVHLAEYVKPIQLIEIERELALKDKEKKDAIKSQKFELAAGVRDDIKKLSSSLEEAEAEWEKEINEHKPKVKREHVVKVVSKITGIPLKELNKDDATRLLEMEKHLSSDLVGQEEAIRVLSQTIRRSKAGISNPRKPIGTFLFLGPTGVGKTEMARVLTRYLFGNEDALVKIDMSEYMEKFSTSRLIGAPPGYVGYEEGGQLTEPVRRHPYSIVLFDEIEKAHPEVYNLLLQILEDGVLTDSFGRKVNFRNTIVIMTSNIGTKQSQAVKMGFSESDSGTEFSELETSLKNEVKRVMQPELLNRIDKVIVFKPLGLQEITKIVDIQIKEVNERISHKNVVLELTPEAQTWIAKKGFDANLGARPLRRTIQEYIENVLSEKLLTGDIPWERLVVVDHDKEKKRLTFTPKVVNEEESATDEAEGTTDEKAAEKNSVESI